MKSLCLITALFITVFTYAQIVTIPDNNFKFNLISGNNVDNDGDGNYDDDVDINGDGDIQVSEAQAVIGLLLHWNTFPIGTLEGIESFTNLENFKSDNTVVTADFTQNLNLAKIDLRFNANESLILPPSSNLIEVWLQSNDLTSLDVTQNPNLEILEIRGSEITNIDLTQNPNLKELFAGSSELTNIDVTQNPNLTDLSLFANNLTSLDVTQNPNLVWLTFGTNSITEIDLSQNTNLRVFSGYQNPLQSLDFTQNPLISTIAAYNTQLTELDIRNGNNANIANLRVYNNPGLDCIDVDDKNYAYSRSCDKTGFWGWCRGNTSYSEDCSILGLEDYDFQTFFMFPNPAQNVLNIKSQEGIESVKIYSLQGQLIKEVSSTTIDISALSNGLYFVEVAIEGKKLTKKFIKL